MDFTNVFREVYGNSLDGIVISDKETYITEVNPAYERLTGYTRAELIGQKTNVIKSGLTPSSVFGDLWSQLESHGRWVGEIINRRKDGELWHSFLSITQIVDDTGETSYVGIARDVTDRKELEQQLRQNLDEIQSARERADATANRLRAILESVGEAIIMVNNKAVCVVANHLVGSVFGLAAEELSGKSVHELRTTVGRLFRGGGALEWHAGPGGTPPIEINTATVETREENPRVFHEFSAPVHHDDGRVIGRIYVYRDITKETEVDRMKNEFIATVSHELRTPMTSIKGSLGLVLGGIAGPLPEDAKDLLSIAQNNTDRLIRLINDILDISRIEAGKMEIKKGLIVVTDAINRAIRELEGFATERQITVSARFDDDLPRAVADSDRLQQVLVNLLSNAIKFSEAGTEVLVTAGVDEAQIWVRVEDHGSGIPKEYIQQIFEKFQRIDNASTRKTGGTGLGLAICKALVEEHDGRIWAESEPGMGSAFTFTLPVETTPDLSLPLNVGGRTVLVVDDDPDIVRLIMLSLEQEGFQTLGATSGEQALEIARTRRVDAITLDLLMPGMHGLEVARHLKEDPATSAIPLVMISAYASGHESELVALGVNGVIGKPIDEVKLLGMIRGVLGGKHSASADLTPSVLVVDDDADVRLIVGIMLKRAGYSYRSAADGQEAFRMIMEERPDLLILDLMMPNLDGFQLVRLLRQRRWTQQIPLLVLTALDLTEGEKTLLQLGPTRHLTKGPAIQEEIVGRVRELLKGSGQK